MSIVAGRKKCPKCGKMYSWNPDVGKFRCPWCMGTGMKPKKRLDVTTKNKKMSTDRLPFNEESNIK